MTSYICKDRSRNTGEGDADRWIVLAVPTGLSGSMTFGPLTHGNWLGRNSIALDTYLLLGKDTPLPW